MRGSCLHIFLMIAGHESIRIMYKKHIFGIYRFCTLSILWINIYTCRIIVVSGGVPTVSSFMTYHQYARTTSSNPSYAPI